MQTEEPLVSILMNCFNGEKFLREAVDSVLAQTYQNWEVIFWDNQSTDKSAEIFKSYSDPRLKYFYAPKLPELVFQQLPQFARPPQLVRLRGPPAWLLLL